MDKTEPQSVINYLHKKHMTSREIYDKMVQILTEDSLSYADLKKWATKFKQSGDSTEKTSTIDEQVDVSYHMDLA